MSAVIVRPDTLQHLCKEPLADVQSVQLRGRGITRLVRLDACPKVTSLDISWNALTDLDSACLQGCRELWVVDASHNRLESFGGLSSFMALGYLNLSSNSLPLESLRPLAYMHVLELFLGDDRPTQERRRTLGLLPNLWVLDNEFVNAKERCVAEGDFSRGGAARNDHLLLTWKVSSSLDKSEELRDDGGIKCVQPTGTVSQKALRVSRQRTKKKEGPRSGSGFGGLESQGHHVREFYENVLWKLPSRADAADSFRLATLLKRYDQRVTTANKSEWLGRFTCRGVGGGARGCVRRDWSLPLPRPHLEALMSLPLQLRLDVAVMLAVQATFRNSIPQQVLAEALLVLLIPQGGLPDCIHSDLSRVPTFICTALVHALRSSVLHHLDEGSMPGQVDTTARPLLDRQHTDLLEALPPVVTGVDFHNDFELWETSSRNAKGLPKTGEENEISTAAFAGSNDDGVENAAEGSVDRDRDILLPRGELGSIPNSAVAAAAAAALEETCEPSVSPDATYREAYFPPLGIGLTRLCRRAVILLTRSPACPDLVAWQTDPAKQRAYHQMEPLLARANMTYRDLHPRSSSGGGVGDYSTNIEPARSSLSSRQYSPSTPTLALDPSRAAGENGGRSGGTDDRQRQDVTHQLEASVDSVRSPDAGFWSANFRRPKAGEKVQVLHDTWSVIVTVLPDVSSVTVAPFEGIHAPPYRGVSHIDVRDLCYDPRGWWRHAPALTTKVPVGSGRLHRLARGLSTSGLPWGAGSLNESLEESEVARLSQIPRSCSSSGGGRETADGSLPQNYTDLLLDQEIRRRTLSTPSAEAVFSCKKCAPIAVPRPSTTQDSTAGTLRASLVPVVLRQDRCPKTNVVDAFSAEGSWDPMFVMAPPRLVGLQNQTAVRKRGRRRARQVAWHRIDDPEASVAPRPMMPRCSSLSALAKGGDTRQCFLQQPTSKASNPASPSERPPPLLAAVAPSHGGGDDYTDFIQPMSLSVPSIKTGVSSTSAVDEAAGSADNAWLELQRELGSLKADNRVFLRGSAGINAHSLHTSESAVSMLTKSLTENSTACPEATMDLIAKTLSLGLDGPAPAWRGDGPEDPPETVFELTQVNGGPETNTESITVGACVSGHLEVATTTAESRTETPRVGGRTKTIESDDPKNSRCLRRTWRGGNSTTKIKKKSGKWEPHIYRPLEWFPVSGRRILRVDPNDVKIAANDVKVTAAAAAAKPAAVAEKAGQGAKSDPFDRADFMPEGQSGAEGGGGGNNGDMQSVGGRDHAENRRREERNKPQDNEGGEREGRKITGSGGQQRGPGSGGEGDTQSSFRSEISLSTRSAFPSAAVLVGLLPSPKASNRAGAGAKATILAGSRRSRPSTVCSGRGSQNAGNSATPGGVSPPKPHSAVLDLLANHSKQSLSETMGGAAQLRGGYRTLEVSRRDVGPSSPALSAHGIGAIGPFGLPQNGLRNSSSPNEWQRGGQGQAQGGRGWGRGGGGGGGGRVEADVLSSRRQQGAAAAAAATAAATATAAAAAAAATNLLANRQQGIQANRLALRPKAREAVEPRLLRDKGCPPQQVPQRQRREVISGWEGEGEKASVVAEKVQSRTVGGRFVPQGRWGQSSVKMSSASPHLSDNALDDCFSISSTVNSSNNSCCGWNGPATPKTSEE